jgi:hypothetical protein
MHQQIIGLLGVRGSGKDSVSDLVRQVYGAQAVAFADPLKRLARSLFEFSVDGLWGPSALRNDLDSRALDPGFWKVVGARVPFLYPVVHQLFAGAPPGTTDPIPALYLELDWLEQYRAQFSPRLALQRLGTEWGRCVWRGVWLQAAFSAIRELYTPFVVYDREQGAVRVPGGTVASTTHYYGQPIQLIVITDCRFPDEAAAIRAHSGLVVWIDASQRLGDRPPEHASEPTFDQFHGLIDYVLDNNGPQSALPDRVRELVAVCHATIPYASSSPR